MQKTTINDLPPRQPGETMDQWSRRVVAWIRGDNIRSKTELHGKWTGSPKFHLNKEEK